MVLTLCNTSFRKEFVFHVVQIWIQGSILYDAEDYPVLCLRRKFVEIKLHGAVVQRGSQENLPCSLVVANSAVAGDGSKSACEL